VRDRQVTHVANWRRTRPAPSRLEEGREVYTLALDVAKALDRAGLDLWAAGIRACLDAPSSLARQQHLTVELVRLRDTGDLRRAGCAEDIERALSRLELGLGSIDVPQQPLYTATRNLADHLELNGGRRWLARLRTVITDPDRGAAARVERLDALAERMVPGAEGLPEGSASLVRAVRGRLNRHLDMDAVALHLAFALTPPAPSRIRDDQQPR